MLVTCRDLIFWNRTDIVNWRAEELAGCCLKLFGLTFRGGPRRAVSKPKGSAVALRGCRAELEGSVRSEGCESGSFCQYKIKIPFSTNNCVGKFLET